MRTSPSQRYTILVDDGELGPRALRWLAGTTAIVAGLVNVCSVMAFFTFSSNVTGHVALFVHEVLHGRVHELSIVAGWIACFVGGAFVGNLFVTAVSARYEKLGRAAPAMLEIVVLAVVAWYGHHHFDAHHHEVKSLVALLLFAMGLHNGTVATVSRGLVKTTHLTGLSTNLGMAFSQLVQGRVPRGSTAHFTLTLELLIFGAYVGGGLIGGLLFQLGGFVAFLFGSLVLLGVLLNDAAVHWTSREPRPSSPAMSERPRSR
ncbi:MAG: YoaK family protein [Sandaracinaceae bacterium]